PKVTDSELKAADDTVEAMESIKGLSEKIKSVFLVVTGAVEAVKSTKDEDMAKAIVAVAKLKKAANRSSNAAEQVLTAIEAIEVDLKAVENEDGLGKSNQKLVTSGNSSKSKMDKKNFTPFKGNKGKYITVLSQDYESAVEGARNLVKYLAEISSIIDEMVKFMAKPTLEDLEDVMDKADTLKVMEIGICSAFNVLKSRADNLTTIMKKSPIKEIEIAETEIDKIKKMMKGVGDIIRKASYEMKSTSGMNLRAKIIGYDTTYEYIIKACKDQIDRIHKNKRKTCLCGGNENNLWHRYNYDG
ncbi:MAG: hypothetical protein ACRCS6_07050, partial [Turicibacter sp.]